MQKDIKLQEFIENPTLKRGLKVEGIKQVSSKLSLSPPTSNLLGKYGIPWKPNNNILRVTIAKINFYIKLQEIVDYVSVISLFNNGLKLYFWSSVILIVKTLDSS